MPEDYYNDGPDSAPEQSENSAPDKDSDGDSQTALLPRSIFGGDVNPGDYITLCVEKVDGDDVLCRKDEGGKDKEKEEPQHMAEEPQNPSGDSTSGMSSMLSD